MTASSIDDIIKRTGLDVVENRLIRNLVKRISAESRYSTGDGWRTEDTDSG